jgi:uncharacterized protein YdhG (YjbR/CyaY superfamily)
MTGTPPATIDEYIADCTPAVRPLLEQVRQTVRNAAPEATEAIKYAIPCYIYHGNLVYFAAYSKHIGFYPVPTNDPDFAPLLEGYKTGKGSIQFPLDRPLPLDLIHQIVVYYKHRNALKAQLKGKTKPPSGK